MYLHEIADSDISFTKEDMHMGKHAEYERRLIDTVLNKTLPQSQEKRNRSCANRNTACWDQNGSETSEETDSTRDGGYNGGEESPPGDPTSSEIASQDRQSSPQDKENIPKSDRSNQAAAQSLPHTSSGLKSSSSSPVQEKVYSSIDCKTSEPEAVVDRKSISLKSIERPKQLNSIYNQDTDSKLLRLLCGNEDTGSGMIPAPAPVREAPAPLVNWQTLLGLSPQTTTNNTISFTSSALHPSMTAQKTLVTKSPPGFGGFTCDDDLGFDPFNESSKGLARLLEEEEKVKQPSIAPYMSQHVPLHLQQQRQEAFSLRDLWSRPSLMASVNSVQPHSSPLEMFASLVNNQHSQPHHQQMQHQLHYPFEHHAQHQHQTHQQHPQHRQQYDPYCAPPPGLTPPQRPTISSQSISDWQEGLKALLPNVNVRFVSDLEGANHNGSSLHHLHQPHATQHSSLGARWFPSTFGLEANGRIAPHHMVQHTVPPPPGFSVPNR
ncbi:hypothetical protein DICVIV_10084 [Dictyocaulus viviparus]|uniref:Uncharacterized protein n=1 Tax=Dictyocaulus viviparus TaxID=29172 RepID=A0A0D8XJA3_DICVI|nr:hypothetical protein DICVIV_10084 [Dictyocaulus viviparus]